MTVVRPLPLRTARLSACGCLGLLLGLAAIPALAQPGAASPEAYGDRQAGVFSDPGQGHFGNPAAGNFDIEKMPTPPPGTRPLGRVLDRKAAEPPPYVTLPEPPVEPPKKTADGGKKSPRKRKASRGS